MRDIKGFEGLYAITSCGKVWSYRSKKFLKPSIVNGYERIDLRKNGTHKNCFIHRLVAEAYLPNPDNLPQVNHKDENKLHNWLNNLEWCNCNYNINYGSHNDRVSIGMMGNNNGGKTIICIETGVIYKSGREAQRHTGINNGNISRVCNGKAKTAGGYHWEHYNGED